MIDKIKGILTLRLLLILLLVLPHLLSGETYFSWHDIIGRSFEAKIVSVGSRTVKLENREGVQIDFPIADLKTSSKDQVQKWLKLQNAAASSISQSEVKESVFDSVLLGNLQRLDGKRLKRSKDATRPKKYYIFYYTASWCGPCQKFTPSLVEWYNENKNENFEIVLITSDRNEDAMEDYAAAKNMPWPQLELDAASDFKEEFEHGVTGIPSVIVCELDGKNLGNFRSNLSNLTRLVK